MRTAVTVMALGLLAGAANAAMLCAAKKTGAVKLRETACKTKENAIDPVALGLQGPPGTAIAYAHVVVVGQTPTVDPTRSRSVTNANITRVATGVFCFHDLTFTPKSAVPTIDAAASTMIDVAAAGLPPDPTVLAACGSDVQAVVTTAAATAANVDVSFYVIFN